MPWTNTELPAEPGVILITLHQGSRSDASPPNRPLPPALPAHFPGMKRLAAGLLALSLGLAAGAGVPRAGSLDLGANTFGLSIGNSKNWTGLRINTQDIGVERVTGVNLTLWKPGDNGDATITGLSLGLVAPDAGTLRGVQLGLLGVGATRKISGISAGLLGVGSEGSLSGISIGGIGVGAGEDMTGISIGGLGAGAGHSMKGISFGLLAAGAGDNVTGITIAGLAAGAGDNVRGITFALLAAGAGDNVTGFTFGGLAAGGKDVHGMLLTAGLNRISNDGSLRGLAIGSFNQVRGSQTGLSLGIVNYTRQLRGIQIGLINYVAENPAIFRTLPIVNAHF